MITIWQNIEEVINTCKIYEAAAHRRLTLILFLLPLQLLCLLVNKQGQQFDLVINFLLFMNCTNNRHTNNPTTLNKVAVSCLNQLLFSLPAVTSCTALLSCV